MRPYIIHLISFSGCKIFPAVFPLHTHTLTDWDTVGPQKHHLPGMLWTIIGGGGGVRAGIIISYSPVQYFNLCGRHAYYLLKCISRHIYIEDKPCCINVEFTSSCGAWIVIEWKELWTRQQLLLCCSCWFGSSLCFILTIYQTFSCDLCFYSLTGAFINGAKTKQYL